MDDRRYLEVLADDARPVDFDDWGSERQVKAQNDFFDTLDLYLTGRLTEQERHAFDVYCLKATVDEMLDEGLRLACIAIGREYDK